MFRLAGLLVLAIVILLSSSEAKDTDSCSDVIKQVAPCASFLQETNSDRPSEACCKGIKSLNDSAKTKKDRVAVCKCIKEGLDKIGKYDPKRIPELPKACGVTLSLPPIDKDFDCQKVPIMMMM